MAVIKQLTTEQSDRFISKHLTTLFPETKFNVRRDKHKTIRWCDDANDTSSRLYVTWMDGVDVYEVNNIIRHFTVDKADLWGSKKDRFDIRTSKPSKSDDFMRVRLCYRSYRTRRLLSKSLSHAIHKFLCQQGAPQKMFHIRTDGKTWFVERNFNVTLTAKERSKIKVGSVMLSYVAGKLSKSYMAGDKLEKFLDINYKSAA